MSNLVFQRQTESFTKPNWPGMDRVCPGQGHPEIETAIHEYCFRIAEPAAGPGHSSRGRCNGACLGRTLACRIADAVAGIGGRNDLQPDLAAGL